MMRLSHSVIEDINFACKQSCSKCDTCIQTEEKCEECGGCGECLLTSVSNNHYHDEDKSILYEDGITIYFDSSKNAVPAGEQPIEGEWVCADDEQTCLEKSWRIELPIGLYTIHLSYPSHYEQYDACTANDRIYTKFGLFTAIHPTEAHHKTSLLTLHGSGCKDLTSVRIREVFRPCTAPPSSTSHGHLLI